MYIDHLLANKFIKILGKNLNLKHKDIGFIILSYLVNRNIFIRNIKRDYLLWVDLCHKQIVIYQQYFYDNYEFIDRNNEITTLNIAKNIYNKYNVIEEKNSFYINSLGKYKILYIENEGNLKIILLNNWYNGILNFKEPIPSIFAKNKFNIINGRFNSIDLEYNSVHLNLNQHNFMGCENNFFEVHIYKYKNKDNSLQDIQKVALFAFDILINYFEIKKYINFKILKKIDQSPNIKVKRRNQIDLNKYCIIDIHDDDEYLVSSCKINKNIIKVLILFIIIICLLIIW